MLTFVTFFAKIFLNKKPLKSNFATIRQSITKTLTLKTTSDVYKRQSEQLINVSKRLPLNDDEGKMTR